MDIPEGQRLGWLIEVCVDRLKEATPSVGGATSTVQIALQILNRGLCLIEDDLLLNKIAKDSWAIYCHGRMPEDHESVNESTLNNISHQGLEDLIKIEPMRSYLKPSFFHVMNYILNIETNISDTYQLTRLIRELKATFDTICDEDRQLLRKHNKNLSTTVNNSPIDASILIYWALTETAKYCLCQKFSPGLSTNQYLALLQKEIAKSFRISDKLSRKFMVNFLATIEKLLQDRVSPSSLGRQTFIAPDNIEDFYLLNSVNFQTWLAKNQQPLAKLSIIVDEPAECWRLMCLKLNTDLETKFLGTNAVNKEPSFTRTLMSLNSKNWSYNLNLIALASKQLGDSDLLYGLESMSHSKGIIPDYQPLRGIISNMKGNYDESYKFFSESADLEASSYIEFLNCCLATDNLEHHIDSIERLDSMQLQKIYRFHLKLKTKSKLDTSDVREVQQWLGSWQDLNGDSNPHPIQTYIDIVIPVCLKIVLKAPEQDKHDMIEFTETLIGQDFLKQSIFTSNYVNCNYKLYHVLINCLKNNNKLIDDAIVSAHENDYKWNFDLYRHLCDLNLIEKLRPNHDIIDLIQYRAAKFNLVIENECRAFDIFQGLISSTESEKMAAKAKCLILKYQLESESLGLLGKFSNRISEFRVDKELKARLSCKLMNQLMQKDYDWDADDLRNLLIACDIEPDDQVVVDEDLALRTWRQLAHSSDSSTKIKSLVLMSKHVHKNYYYKRDNDDLFNSVVYIELELLSYLSVLDIKNHKAIGIESLSRLVGLIDSNSRRISEKNFAKFRSKTFIETTCPLWVHLKRSLMFMITNNVDISTEWRSALTDVLKTITRSNPELFVYDVLVSRLDKNDSPGSYILPDGRVDSSGANQSHCAKLWDQLYNIINSCDNEACDEKDDSENKPYDWSKIILETENFIKEIRKISYLPHEYLKSLTMRTPKQLINFLEHFTRYADLKTGIINSKQKQLESQRKLSKIRENDLKALKVLTAYYDNTAENTNTKYTIHEEKFYSDFKVLLKELDYRLTLLVNEKSTILNNVSNVNKLIRSINELMAICRTQLTLNQNQMRQTLYMEMISPFLSRLAPSSILMPDCGASSPIPSRAGNLNGTTPLLVTIHSTTQTVHTINSKTSPKRLRFIGSDGKSRSFLLKAHDDLRLDQLIMDLFHLVNIQFLANKGTRDKFNLRSYSVTPVSSRSGLIQWIDAKPLTSFLRSWLSTNNGKKSMESIYKSTCEILCDNHQANSETNQVKRQSSINNHINCEPSHTVNCMVVEPFHQLLWAALRRRNSKHPLAQIRPSTANTTKIRDEFGHSMFVSCVEQMMSIVPKDFLSQQLWFNSCNSHEFWIKTKRFIHSTATISMVGHIIGLGDRHTDNILLDRSTGEVVHIDYSVCFETGHDLIVPEKVPFRLTPNIVHAFGFAGLEGGFTRSCRTVLKLLRDSTSTILCELSSTNLGFMTRQMEPSDELGDMPTSFQAPQRQQQTTSADTKLPPDMEIYSQESIDGTTGIIAAPKTSTTYRSRIAGLSTDLLLVSSSSSPSVNNTNNIKTRDVSGAAGGAVAGAVLAEPTKCEDSHHQVSCYLQDQIKTPTKISTFEAHRIHHRLRDKLTGADELWLELARKLPSNIERKELTRSNAAPSDSRKAKAHSPKDLITLDVDGLTIEDEVEVLIMQAISLENKAAMFEGWVPWL